MSLLWRLLTHRAGDEALPDDIGEDPEPDEPELPEPALAQALYLRDEDFERAAATLNVDLAVIRAVAEVEAAGRGFLADGRPQILYEAHVFDRETQGRHRSVRDSRGKPLSVPAWDRTLYGAAGAWQHDGRLAPAASLNWTAAHRASSWGLFQIMGFNHRLVGHERIVDFVDAMVRGAGPHLDAFVAFIRANRLDNALRSRDWREFARRYNGPAYERNNYHTKLEQAWRRFANA
ncbi:MAG: N-acetylmuramidase family protein [Alphaproteobacteria bacterium]|nr:N-acetylmuramidase family protein [Alphaproteobacteria bacterium]